MNIRITIVLLLLLSGLNITAQTQETGDSVNVTIRRGLHDCHVPTYVVDGKCVDNLDKIKASSVAEVTVSKDKQSVFENREVICAETGTVYISTKRAAKFPKIDESICIKYENTSNDTLYYYYQEGPNVRSNMDSIIYTLERLPIQKDSISIFLNNLGFGYTQKSIAIAPKSGIYLQLRFPILQDKSTKNLNLNYTLIKIDSNHKANLSLISGLGFEIKGSYPSLAILRIEYTYKNGIRIQ